MSTELGTIEGQSESILRSTATVPYYNEKHIHLTRFWGGDERGTCIQLTMDGGDYIQITEKQAKKLVKLINKAYK